MSKNTRPPPAFIGASIFVRHLALRLKMCGKNNDFAENMKYCAKNMQSYL